MVIQETSTPRSTNLARVEAPILKITFLGRLLKVPCDNVFCLKLIFFTEDFLLLSILLGKLYLYVY